MIQQKQLMDQIFKKKSQQLEFKTRKLPLFGEQVALKQIDFSWTAEDDCQRLGMISIPKLTAIRLTNKGKLTSCLAGIQLVFADEICSPVFNSEGMQEDSLVTHNIDQDRKISNVKIRANKRSSGQYYLNELVFSDDDSEIVNSGQYAESGDFHSQIIGFNEQIIGIYGVKDYKEWITSIGFIVSHNGQSS